MFGGIAMMIGVLILVLLPMAAYFYANPQELIGRTAKVAVWAGEHPVRDLAVNTLKTLGMFFVRGDTNWRHNIAGEPILFWPVAAFFAVGLAHTLWRFVHSWRTRGHPGIVQTLLLSWFFVGLLPSLLSTEGSPHALRALVTAPAVYIMAAVGLHWLYLALERWYGSADRGQICLPMRHLPGSWGHRVCVDRSTFVVTVAVLSVLLAVGIGDAQRYFVRWATEPAVADEFTARYTAVAERLNVLPPAALKYVVVTRGDVMVRGIPMSSQTVMFLTDTWMPEQQRAKNIYYLTQQQFEAQQFPRGAIVIMLDPDR
jgi:hypothetical protein